ncbi:MAG TPA: CRISPR-associated endonuclease Cas2 [Chthonomonas sp.]|uniref:CRISPR-associated endonuclease Cas2 n=1 Tax=Chthonomonas sp. TaxID=2282153 RepID=UPI002B4B84B7|nr:CRISPR-associated endonuclease Cas2 [Chthonomonas sp.]HLH79928.1 CRISPR-associated endonuclease Cas2 [Chthonomonas sp.]
MVTYDVNTETEAGRRRLRMVAKACEAFGQRVQNSVFECSLSETNLERLRTRLLQIIDLEQDSLRIYRLKGRREDVVEVHGRDLYRPPSDPLII